MPRSTLSVASPASSSSSNPKIFPSAPHFLRFPIDTIHGLLFDHSYFRSFFILVIIAEAILGWAIIKKVAYTEIDWIAYMEEVSGFLGGEWDYAKLKGQTGPLVYPAGFVYIYSILYYVTQFGKNILLAQYIFLGIYLAFIAVLLSIYHQAKVCPPWVFLFLCISRRIHSIFMLRCFNDCIAMLLLYIAIYLLLRHRWTWCCVFVSLALSVKMNILLFMPALGVLLLQRFGVWRTVPRLLLIILIQVVLATPFLLVHPSNYFHCAFEFDRAFFYKWTVNWKVLEEEIFLSKPLAHGLLGAHAILILLVWNKMLDGGLISFIIDMLKRLFSFAKEREPSSSHHPSGGYITTLMFMMNFVGIVCARSLHYQFYVWYYHTLPLLLYLIPIPNIIRLLLLLLIEYSWNVFPATAQSSGILIFAHLCITIGLLVSKRLPTPPKTRIEAPTNKKVQ